jgi:hypothetical protein
MDTINHLPRYERYVGRQFTCDAAYRPPRRLGPGVTATTAEQAQPFYRRNSRPVGAEVERQPPSNVDAERAILAAILLPDGNNALSAAIEILKPDDFYHVHHQRVFRQMIGMHEAGIAIDMVTLPDQLHRNGQLESCGGVAYINELMDGVPRGRNVEHYARIVKGHSALRTLIHAADAMRQQAFDAEENPEAILARVREAIHAVQLSNGLAGEPAGWLDMFHTFADFDNASPLSFSIKGFLQNDGATMIGGLSGHGKTLVLNSVAKALLAGKGARLWDLFTVEENAVRVIYLIPECTIQSFKHRLQLFDLYQYLRPDDNRLLVRTLSKGPTPCLSDLKILFAAKGAHVILDTAARFGEGDENNAGDNMRGLASDIFALLHSGARSVIAAHHSPKPFARENVMRLENVLRGSGDIGAMLTTAWGIKQVDPDQNIIHVENIKPRDFQPCGPFQIIGRPFINETGDFALHKTPGKCGTLMDETEPDRERGGGAPEAQREAKAANKALMRGWLTATPDLSLNDLARKFAEIEISIDRSTISRYRKDLGL